MQKWNAGFGKAVRWVGNSKAAVPDAIVHAIHETPPGGWRYFCDQTKRWFRNYPAYADLLNDIRRHHKENNLPIGSEWEQRIQAQMCEWLPPEWCGRPVPQTAYAASTALTFDRLKNGTATLLHWFLQGRQRVARQEAERRAVICTGCKYNQPAQGCTGCNSGHLREMVAQIVAGDSTSVDQQLNACAICGCTLRALIWLPLELLQKHEPAELQGQYPEWCWKQRKIELTA